MLLQLVLTVAAPQLRWEAHVLLPSLEGEARVKWAACTHTAGQLASGLGRGFPIHCAFPLLFETLSLMKYWGWWWFRYSLNCISENFRCTSKWNNRDFPPYLLVNVWLEGGMAWLLTSLIRTDTNRRCNFAEKKTGERGRELSSA